MIQFKSCRLVMGVFIWLLSLSAYSQSIPSSQIYHSLLQLKETKRVLYVAAHPDDENTRLIAYLANGEHADVAYLSLTRGDGGQNLIGKELGIELGQIRTQELLKARQTDGGRQYFTRALDFGYSKDPTETLQNWDKQKVLADVVWAIRKFQPDIIITRFNTTPGITHGHHTTSAILAGEAFELAGSSAAFPEQLAYVKTWRPKRIFFNAYNFGGEFKPEQGKKYYAFEVGENNPLLGKTYHQIAADSRTMHKSQGFGSTAGAGNAKDYIEQVEGEDYQNSPFDGITNRWEQLKGGKAVLAQLDILLKNFNFIQPEQNITDFLGLRKAIIGLESKENWVQEKLEKLDQTIFKTLGLKYEYVSQKEIGFPGESIKTELILTNPSQTELVNISFQVLDTYYAGQPAKNNTTVRIPIEFKIPVTESYSQPYWLEKPLDGALFSMTNQQEIGVPFSTQIVGGDLLFTIADQQFKLPVQLYFKYNDQVDGEVKQPFTLVPEVDLSVSKENVFLLSGADPTVTVTVNFRNQILDGNLDFEGIDSTQFRILSIEDVAVQKKRVYKVGFLPDLEGKKVITARFTTASGRHYDQVTKQIAYKHIPNLTYFSPASINLIQANWKVSGEIIGYVPGAGDDVPAVLAALGYKVIMISPEDYSVDYLSQFKAIIVGIRAYNTNSDLAANQQAMMGYVRAGGNLIVQYSTSSPLLTKQLGPYPFTIGRERVTVQESPVISDESSPLLAVPNRITPQDFSGWVQERGLYFASNPDSNYMTPLTMQDPGENPSTGALIHAKIGEGNYVYTGISFFRQLPSGVPGAIKLFINLIEQ